MYKTLVGCAVSASSHCPSFAFQSRSRRSCLLACNHLPARLRFSECSPEIPPGTGPAAAGWTGPPAGGTSATSCVSASAADRAEGKGAGEEHQSEPERKLMAVFKKNDGGKYRKQSIAHSAPGGPDRNFTVSWLFSPLMCTHQKPVTSGRQDGGLIFSKCLSSFVLAEANSVTAKLMSKIFLLHPV